MAQRLERVDGDRSLTGDGKTAAAIRSIESELASCCAQKKPPSEVCLRADNLNDGGRRATCKLDTLADTVLQSTLCMMML